MREIVLRAKDLAAGYDGRAVVRDVSFAVRSGEIVTLLGPNGAGKSTVLKSIAMQLEAIAGTVYLREQPANEIDLNKIAKELSILNTDRVRAERLTARDVVSLGRYPYTGTLGILSPHDRAVVDETMERLRVAELAGRDFDALSDGQRQRVMLARALCQEPEVLVLDEPTSFLDVRYQLELLTLLRQLVRERGLAAVLSLHELELARRVADTLVCVRDGAVDRAGAPEDILTDRYIEELYQMPQGSYGAFFGRGESVKAEKAYAFFQNRACDRFPCHKGVPEAEFNCLFCYCPLYALGDRCGGNFHYTEKGSKSCVDCIFPHQKANYEKVLARYPEIAALSSNQRYVRSGQKLLRCGYTTGSCAAMAAGAAARLLLSGEAQKTARLVTPKGTTLAVELAACEMQGDAARCAVRKDAGDDPDATDGCLVYATVRKTEQGIAIDGGEGVGRVTKPGLDQPVGAAAINTVPRQMIAAAVAEACAESGYDGGLSVVISVPEGAEIAKKTFNPMLGIEGGISILGTSGVVEPMSEQAVVDTIETELRQRHAEGAERVILTPGNYGLDFLRQGGIDAHGVPSVKYSNFLGDALDLAVTLGFREALLVGHIGKLVKLAGGVMNTHSKYADCRVELFCAHAARCGADTATCGRLMDAATADACIAILDEAQLREPVMESLLSAMQRHLEHRAGNRLRVGAVVFSNEYGLLGKTAAAEAILEDWSK